MNPLNSQNTRDYMRPVFNVQTLLEPALTVADLDTLPIGNFTPGTAIAVNDDGTTKPSLVMFNGTSWSNILSGNISPDILPVVANTGWTSNAVVYDIGPSTGFIAGYFTATSGSPSFNFANLPAPYTGITGRFDNLHIVLGAAAQDVVTIASNTLTITNTYTFTAGDIIYMNFAFYIGAN